MSFTDWPGRTKSGHEARRSNQAPANDGSPVDHGYAVRDSIFIEVMLRGKYFHARRVNISVRTKRALFLSIRTYSLQHIRAETLNLRRLGYKSISDDRLQTRSIRSTLARKIQENQVGRSVTDYFVHTFDVKSGDPNASDIASRLPRRVGRFVRV